MWFGRKSWRWRRRKKRKEDEGCEFDEKENQKERINQGRGGLTRREM